jgi:predicted aspartyl protease
VIEGQVDREGVPVITIEIGGTLQRAVIDTGFNGNLELPVKLKPAVNARFIRSHSLAAGGRTVH